MAEFTKVIGNKIICTGKVCTNGQMVENMKGVIRMIKKRAMASTPIPTAGAIKANGATGNSTAKDYSSALRAYLEKESGKMAKGSTG